MEGFTQGSAQVGDVRINYLRGGDGPTLVLLHGYPQTCYMWRKVMPAFAEHYTVVAPDLRGAGASDAPAHGYDKKTLAADVDGLLGQLALDHDVRVVGHDVGTMVGYAYAAAHPDRVRRLVLTEAPIPDESIYQLPALTPRGPGAWNFGFFTAPGGFAEQTVTGREQAWVQGFIGAMAVRPETIGADAIDEYSRCLRDADHLRASFEYFRALPQDVADNAEAGHTKLAMPVLALGAEASFADAVQQQVSRYATDVEGGVVDQSGHWLFEERPDELTRRLLDFLR